MTTARAGTLLKGLGALAALAVGMVGVPLLLETVAGSPIPDALPTWSQIGTSLTSRDDGTLLLALLKYAAWAGWALFVLSVVADVLTRLRGLPTPRLGPQQQLATQLVGAVLALAVSVPTALPAAAFPPPPTTTSQSLAASGPGSHGVAAAGLETGASADEQQSFEEYRVRRGDCLWDIAWNELGEPERWPEIYQASRTVRQPDGRRLTDPDLIVNGWVLHIPAPPSRPSTSDPRAMHDDGSTPPADDDTWTLPDPESLGDAIVTPLRGGSRRSANSSITGSTRATGAEATRVTTALNTPAVSGSHLSSLEMRWHAELEGHQVAVSHPRNWRRHLIRDPD